MARKTTQEEVEKAISMKLEGMTIEDIASALSRSTFWVSTHTKGVAALSGNKSQHATCKDVNVEEGKRLKRFSKLMRRPGGIPVVYGGLNTNKM